MWGEFGGFKHPDAIWFEAASMVAYGAGCSFGDQLHPNGTPDLSTYENIGAGYEYVRQIEAYGVGATPVSRLGVWLTGVEAHDQGVTNMLLETQNDFLVVDPEEDLSRYDTIILTGAACLDENTAAKLEAFAASGGGLVVLGESALDNDRQKFVLDVGADYLGPAQYENDYLVVGETLAAGLPSSPFLNYAPALRTQPTEEAEVLASLHEPYFNRTYARYCSHQNTPYRPERAEHPGAVRNGNIVFLPNPLGAMYHDHGARVHRDLFKNALDLVYDSPMVRTSLPSAGRVTLLHQPENNRYVAHLMYSPPLQRGRCLVIEDLVSLYDVPLEVSVPENVREIRTVPDNESLSVEGAEHGVKTVIPQIKGHCAVVLAY